MESNVTGRSKIKLSTESYAGLLTAERALTDMLPEFDKAEECGIDCQIFRQATADYLERIGKMKLHYAP